MQSIELTTNQVTDVTLVPHIFIDSYMPAANGSYVKVYLYLLRCLSNPHCEISISSIADHLEDSEKDITRALAYWEKVNVLSLGRDKANQINRITVNDLRAAAPDTSTADSASKAFTQEAETEEIEAPNAVHKDKPTYTQAQIAELTKNEEVTWLLKIVEIYLERFLKPADIQLILYLYENIGFSVELIMYLYEYCAQKNKKNPSYIEAVAISWAEEGIDTVEKAEATAVLYNSAYSAVNKAFGLNRIPGDVERRMINKWHKELGFDVNVIVEACNRTLLSIQKPDFKYADSILENWHKNNVHHVSDIAKLDEAHSKNSTKSQHQTKDTAPRPSNNKFNAFPQRNYTKEDYSSMEQRLLTK